MPYLLVASLNDDTKLALSKFLPLLIVLHVRLLYHIMFFRLYTTWG